MNDIVERTTSMVHRIKDHDRSELYADEEDIAACRHEFQTSTQTPALRDLGARGAIRKDFLRQGRVGCNLGFACGAWQRLQDVCIGVEGVRGRNAPLLEAPIAFQPILIHLT